MNDFDSIIKRITVTHIAPGDYTGEDGLLYCGKCHTPKQFRMEAPPLEGRLLPHPCHCEQERLDREAAEQEAHRHRQAVADLKSKGFTDPAMWEWTFANDNGKCPQMKHAHFYVENWPTMQTENRVLSSEQKRTKEEHTMRKALIYGLTLAFALTLTACGQPRAEEPGAPDPAASAAVQTASPEETTEPTATPEPSEETPTAPAETDAQPAEDTAPEEIPAEQDPEDPGEAVTTQPTEETEATVEPETVPTTKPTQQTTQTSGSDSTQTTQPSGTGDTLAGEPNNSGDDSNGGGSSPIGPTTLTSAE